MTSTRSPGTAPASASRSATDSAWASDSRVREGQSLLGQVQEDRVRTPVRVVAQHGRQASSLLVREGRHQVGVGPHVTPADPPRTAARVSYS